MLPQDCLWGYHPCIGNNNSNRILRGEESASSEPPVNSPTFSGLRNLLRRGVWQPGLCDKRTGVLSKTTLAPQSTKGILGSTVQPLGAMEGGGNGHQRCIQHYGQAVSTTEVLSRARDSHVGPRRFVSGVAPSKLRFILNIVAPLKSS